ncbi:UDP-2,3-diacylglucosamine diphosphatase [Candidatus Burkholderia pumila]|uniref:UDP-2,3-diacylglucosamine hydrolase n=1 Tax=Candidatus Burkholderia pumila TaxID=1090375 RepID=A0ABR5HNS3_9BURK|nr:UDP-2,3-diacylglucosamine diphosphatase [Candidatus Burkholderia pumila]
MIESKTVGHKIAGAAHDARPLFFIADLHLSDAIPKTVAAFEHFIRVTANQASAVFILGDLFEFWIGDDVLSPSVSGERAEFARRIVRLLHTLSERGIRLFVMHGNRDFLLGDRFMKEAGAIELDDTFVLTAFGTRIVLAHGDGLCTADHGYQRFRRFARNRVAQKVFLALPLQTRMGIGYRMRMKSHGARSGGMSPKYDVTKKAVSALFIGSHTYTMIHGHTHRPTMHHEIEGTRWVLPDWELDATDAPRGGYLRFDGKGVCAVPL